MIKSDIKRTYNFYNEEIKKYNGEIDKVVT